MFALEKRLAISTFEIGDLIKLDLLSGHGSLPDHEHCCAK
jgi:hypothetical protein